MPSGSPVDLNGAASALLQGLGLGENVRARRENLQFNRERAAQEDAYRQQVEQQRIAEYRQKLQDANDKIAARELQRQSDTAIAQFEANPNDTGEGITTEALMNASESARARYAKVHGDRVGSAADKAKAMAEYDAAKRDGVLPSIAPETLKRWQKAGVERQPGDLPKPLAEQAMQKKAQEMANDNAYLIDTLGIPQFLDPLGQQQNPTYMKMAGLPTKRLEQLVKAKHAEEVAKQKQEQALADDAEIAAILEVPIGKRTGAQKARLHRLSVATDTQTAGGAGMTEQDVYRLDRQAALDKYNLAKDAFNAAKDVFDSTGDAEAEQAMRTALDEMTAAKAAVTSKNVPRGTSAAQLAGEPSDPDLEAAWKALGPNADPAAVLEYAKRGGK